MYPRSISRWLGAVCWCAALLLLSAVSLSAVDAGSQTMKWEAAVTNVTVNVNGVSGGYVPDIQHVYSDIIEEWYDEFGEIYYFHTISDGYTDMAPYPQSLYAPLTSDATTVTATISSSAGWYSMLDTDGVEMYKYIVQPEFGYDYAQLQWTNQPTVVLPALAPNYQTNSCTISGYSPAWSDMETVATVSELNAQGILLSWGRNLVSVKLHRCLLFHMWYGWDSIQSTSGLRLPPNDVPCDFTYSAYPGWANGFDFDPDPETEGDNSGNTDGVAMSNMDIISIHIPGQRFSMSLDYPASDPSQVVMEDGKPRLPESGNVRLWTRDMSSMRFNGGSANRKKAPVSAGGDYFAPGEYSGNTLPWNEPSGGLPGEGGRTFYLHIEGVKPGPATFTINVTSYWTDERGQEQSVTTSATQTVVVKSVDNPGPVCTPCECPDNKASEAGSHVDNGMQTTSHEAVDFCYPSASSSCSSCTGGVTSGVYSRPTMQTRRVHRYDLQEWPSSFGPGVFHGYDLRLRGNVNQSTWSLWDPARPQVVTLTGQGWSLVDMVQGSLRHIVVYDANGAVTYPGLSAVRAVLYEIDGRQVAFDLIPAATNDPHATVYGRPTRIQDAQGQGIDLSYIHPRNATDEALGGDRSQLWKLQTIRDAYGLEVGVSYGGNIAGVPTISTLTYPNNTAAVYGYRTGGSVPGLSSVQQLDGTTTNIDVSGSADEIAISISDPMADGDRQSKSLILTAPSPSVAKAWRVKRIVKAAGESWYRSQETGDQDGNNVTLVQEGERIFKHITNRGVPIRTDYLKSGSWENALSTGVWEKGRSYIFDNRNRMTVRRDALDREMKITPDAVTGYPLRIDYADMSYESWLYDGDGNALEHRDRLGRITYATYNGHRQKLTETSPDGAERSWSYDPVSGAMLTSTAPNGAVTTYGYDALGRLETIAEPGNQQGDPDVIRRFNYDAMNRLWWSEDAYGNQTTYLYDARGRLTRTTYADQSYEENTYGTGANAGRIVMRRSRNGHLTDLAYDAAGRLVSETARVTHADGSIEAVGHTATYILGTSIEKSRTTRGESAVFARDAQRRVTSETIYATKNVALTTSYDYDIAGRRIRTTDAYGRRTFSVYDINDRVVRSIREALPGAVSAQADLATMSRDTRVDNPRWVIEEMSYDTSGQMTTRTNGRGVVTFFTYDDDGRVLTMTEAYGTTFAVTTSYTYDDAGNRLTVTSPRGVVTKMTYNRNNLPWTTIEAFGSADEQLVATSLYTQSRKLQSVADALGHATIYHYAGCCDRLMHLEDAAGFMTGFAYDYVGNRTGVTDPNLLTVGTTFDALNRPLTSTDGAGKTTIFRYDDHLTDGVGLEVTYGAHITPLGFGYDAATGYGADGSALLVTNPLGEKTLEVRDGLGRIRCRVDPLGHATTFSYDQVVVDQYQLPDASAVTQSLIATSATDAENHTTKQLTDGLGRVRVQVDGAGHKTRLSYDAVGNQTAQYDANGVGWTAVFSLRGFLLSRSDTRDAGPVTTSWGYDLDGNRTSEAVTIDGVAKTESYTYDLRNRRKSITDRLNGETFFDYDDVGNLLSIIDAEGGKTAYVYDERNLLTEETFPGPTGGTRSYTYDPGRRLKTRTQQGAAVGGN